MEGVEERVPIIRAARCRHSASKRSLASGLLRELREGVEEGLRRWVEFDVTSREAREEGRASKVEGVVSAYEEDVILISDARSKLPTPARALRLSLSRLRTLSPLASRPDTHPLYPHPH